MTWAFNSILFPDYMNWVNVERQSRKTLFYEFQEGKCKLCRENFSKDQLTTDHIKPKCESGKSSLDNLQLICQPCHNEKNSSEALMRKYVRAFMFV